MVSLAILKTIDTSSTLIMVSLEVMASSSEKEASPKKDVLTVSGIFVHLYVENEFLFKLTKNDKSNNEHQEAYSKA